MITFGRGCEKTRFHPIRATISITRRVVCSIVPVVVFLISPTVSLAQLIYENSLSETEGLNYLANGRLKESEFLYHTVRVRIINAHLWPTFDVPLRSLQSK